MTHHIHKQAEYDQIVKEMAKDQNRTARQRQVESCYGKALPAILEELRQKNDGNKSEMMRELNQTLENNGIEQSVSRPTIYNWLKDMDD